MSKQMITVSKPQRTRQAGDKEVCGGLAPVLSEPPRGILIIIDGSSYRPTPDLDTLLRSLVPIARG